MYIIGLQVLSAYFCTVQGAISFLNVDLTASFQQILLSLIPQQLGWLWHAGALLDQILVFDSTKASHACYAPTYLSVLRLSQGSSFHVTCQWNCRERKRNLLILISWREVVIVPACFLINFLDLNHYL